MIRNDPLSISIHFCIIFFTSRFNHHLNKEKMKKTMQKWITPVAINNVYADLLLALPRIVACFFLATRFGWSKFPTPDWFIKDVAALGLPLPFFFAWAAVITEVIGAGCLVIGLGTRVWGFMLTCTMLVAIFLQKWDGELWEKLPAMGFLWVAIYAIVLGSGRFGLDYWIAKRFFREG
jgi:putative oxidoreductase